MPRPFIKTNQQALRWCQTRSASIRFYKNMQKDVSPQVSCRVSLIWNGEYSHLYGATLVQAVNRWIDAFNQEDEGKKPKKEA